MTDLGGGRDSLPCFKCGKEMQRIENGGYFLQPDDGLHFDTTGAYGTTVFDPMDGSSLNIIICDECIVEGARKGLVHLDQKYIGIDMVVDAGGPGVAAGFYSPMRESVPWDPDTDYEAQEPLRVDPEDVAAGEAEHSTVMWNARAIKYAREFLAAEEEAKDDVEAP